VLAGAAITTLAGTRFGSRAQVVLAAGVCVLLTVAIVAALPQVRWDAFTPFAPQGVTGVGTGVVVLFFAFSGWEAISHLSAEFTDPQRTLPKATLITLLVVAVLYFGIAFAVVGTRSYGSADLDNVSLARVVSGQFGGSPAVALAVAATVICVGTTNAFMASISQLGFALGRDGLAPRALGRLGARGVPTTAVLVVTGTGAAGLAGSAIFGWGTATFVYIPSTLVLTTYLMATAAGIRLLPGRRKAIPAAGLILILAVTPSAGKYLAIPLAITAAAIGRQLLISWKALSANVIGADQR
jgi:amino acid efflux transporter